MEALLGKTTLQFALWLGYTGRPYWIIFILERALLSGRGRKRVMNAYKGPPGPIFDRLH